MRRDIQALRGLAVLAVILYHVGGFGFHGGFLGVDIFFVISGYVITKKLSETEGALPEVLKGFYLRRIRRILPTSVLVITLTMAGSYLFLSPLSFHRIAMDGWAATLLVPNLFFLHQQTNYLNQGLDASPFLHYWSLGVEEQFYFLWPLVFFTLFKKRILPVLISLIVFAGVGIIWTSHNSVQSFYLPFTRFWEFMAGAALIYLPPLAKLWSGSENKKSQGLTGFFALFAWAAAIISTIFITSEHPTPGLTTVIPVLAATGIILVGFNAPLLRPMAWLGDISFSLYLVHWPVIIFFANGKISLALTTRIFIIALSIGIAAVMYYLYENPVRRSKKIAARSLLVLVVALLIGSLSAGGLQAASSRVTTSTKAFSIDLSEPIIYANGCHLAFDVVQVNGPCVFGDTSATRTIALVGDSHAAQWFAGLNLAAKTHHWKLLALTKSSCPPAIWAIKRAGALDKACVSWAAKVQKQLSTIKPEITLLSSYTQYQYSIDPTIAVAAQASMAGPSYAEKWSAALYDFAQPLISAHNSSSTGSSASAQAQSRVIILGDTPNPPLNSPSCLAKHLTKPSACDFNYVASAATTQTKSLASNLGIEYLDPISWLCVKNSCPAIFGKHNTYRDASHISVATSLYFSATMAKALNL